MRDWLKRYGLYLSWLVAALGTLISLYFSNIKNMEPCHLCWYQRICLFPLAVILAMATYKGLHAIASFLLPQTLLGFLLALYQVAIQEIPGWNPINICGAGPSCSKKILIGIGPVTIPMLSALGFLLISTLLVAVTLADTHDRSLQLQPAENKKV